MKMKGSRLPKFLLMLTTVTALVGQAHAVKIADQGTAQAVVVVAPDATPPVRHAAAELVSFLGQVTGAKFELVNAGQAGLFVGPGAAKMADPAFTDEGLGDQGIVIRTVGENLILAGGEPRGTLYAVYSFLEDYVGCHWWTAGASTIPRKPTLAFENVNVRYIPPLEYRDTNYAGAGEADYSVRNKFNGQNHRLFYDDGLSNTQQDLYRGGRKFAFVKSDRWGGHALWMMAPPQVYFKDHPEWYSMIDGKRTAEDVHHSSLCLTNPELRQRIVENSILALWGHPHASILSLEQWDDGGPPDHCQCPECAKVEKEEGSAAGIMVRFTNAVMDDFRKQSHKFEKGIPPVTVLAYHYTQKPPLHAKPDPNIIVRLCPIHADYSIPLGSDGNKEFRDDFIGWSKITDRIHIWYYSTNFGYPMLPYPNFGVMGKNLKYLTDNSVKGIFAEGMAVPGGEMSELRSWMLGQLSWNPNRDPQQLIRQFADGYYGAAGPSVVAALDSMQKSLAVSGDKLLIDMPPTSKFLNFEALNTGWTHLQAAEAAVKDDPTLTLRVRDAQLPYQYAFIMNWDELQKQAAAANKPWPIATGRKETMEAFVREASGRRGFPAEYLRLPVL